MPRPHPWRDSIFPQVAASRLLENHVVASPQGPPRLGGSVSLQSQFKCLIFGVSRSAFVCALKGLGSNKWEKKINRRQYMKCRGFANVNANYCLSLCESDSGLEPDGTERRMKGGDKRWTREVSRHRAGHCSLDHSHKTGYVSARPSLTSEYSLWAFGQDF